MTPPPAAETDPAPTAFPAGPRNARVTRLAPSPTGALHLGNARTFLINWAHARQVGAAVRLRVDDLDTPRNKHGSVEQAVADLAWLGLAHDGPVVRESDTPELYTEALATLRTAGLTYRCPATRKQIAAAASAPHAGDAEPRYPGLYRPENRPPPFDPAAPAAVRLRVPDGPVAFTDGFAGPQTFEVQRSVGDFLVATKAGPPAYQLAVVLDDAYAGVTDVVRGDDLLPSTARQIHVRRALAAAGHRLPNGIAFRPDPASTPGADAAPAAATPRWWHVPLVLGTDGRRLAKRHGAARVAALREAGVPATRVVGLLAHLCGTLPAPAPLSAVTFATRFSWARLPPGPVTLTPDHERWLYAR